jgi:hypothetical protein
MIKKGYAKVFLIYWTVIFIICVLFEIMLSLVISWLKLSTVSSFVESIILALLGSGAVSVFMIGLLWIEDNEEKMQEV